MDDEPPPRKQLRLLVKGREKVGELLRRRRHKKKTQKNINPRDEHVDSDIEDEVPILSRITDPASVAKPPLRIKLKVTTPDDNNDQQSSPALKQPDTVGTKPPRDEKIDVGTMKVNEKTIKAQRRKGIIGIEDLKDAPQATFTTQTIMTQRRPIATQPSSAQQSTQFTFNSKVPAASGSDRTASFGLQIAKVGLTPPQLQRVVRDVFQEPKSEPETVASREALPKKKAAKVQSQNTNVGTRSGLRESGGLQAMSSMAAPKDNRIASQHAGIQTNPVKRLFDNLKLGANTVAQPPRIDTADRIDGISDFVPSQVPVPGLGPAIYRSINPKTTISRALIQKSLPDSTETQRFVEDVENGLLPVKKTEKGDVPALTHDNHNERVPIGARLGNTAMSIFPGSSITQPRHNSTEGSSKLRESFLSVPENLHTEPNRLAKAYLFSTRQNLKRKRRADATLPPPSYIHQHTSRPTFNVFSNGIVLYPELCLLLAAHLPVQTLINLYSVSKDYHIILNQRITTVILNQASIKAPAAVQCYPWRCYSRLCQSDPAYVSATFPLTKDLTSRTTGSTINIPPPPPNTHESISHYGPNNTHTLKNTLVKLPPSKRKVPTFRWLQMALHREKTMHEIYQLFAARGVPLPGDPTDTSRNSFCLTLHKLWFAFDIPDNIRRIAYFKSNTMITPVDLANILTFIIKVDMVCNDPVAGEKRDALRKLIMSSVNGFDTLRKVLKREMWTDELEILRAWTQYGFQLDREDGNERARGGGWVPLGLDEDDHAASDYVFGIPRDEVGLLKKEFWGQLDYDTERRLRTLPAVGRKTSYLMRPDQIVLREAVRRGMRMGKQFLRALMYGYVDEETLEAVPARDLNGGRSRILEEEGEYGVDDLVGGVRALRVEDGGDPLLDLGDTWEGSVLTVKHVGARKQQVERIKEENERLEAYKQGWKEDVEQEEARRAYRGFTYVDE